MNTSNSASNMCPNCFSQSFFDGKCSICGYIGLTFSDNNIILPPGTTLNKRYTLGRVLGAGGFGVTYLARDNLSGVLCAVKEYFPMTYAIRAKDYRIMASSEKNDEFYKHGLGVFINEAKILESFRGIMTIVQIIEYFYDNNSAYFSMEYLNGVNVKALVKSMKGRVPVPLAAEIYNGVLETLNIVHQKGMLHRDISPENILLTQKGEIKLIDFGATRYYMSEKSRNLSVILKPGFAPPEQYSSKGNQGPWTDIYALAATFYYIVTGKMPDDAMDRLHDDRLPALRDVVPSIDGMLCNIIKKSLALDYRKRYQSVTEILSELNHIPIQNRPPTAGQARPAQGNNQPRRQAQPPPVIAGAPAIESIPYIRMIRGRFSGSKWIIPKNIDVRVGRNSQVCNIVLDDMNISRQHCIIRYDDKKGIFLVRDISTNGMFNSTGEKLQKDAVYVFSPGDELSLSNEDYKFKIGLDM